MNDVPEEIETGRLSLHPIRRSDLDALVALWSDPSVMQFLPGNRPRTVEAAQAELAFMLDHWKAHGIGAWAIFLRGQDEMIGYCYLQYLHPEPGGVTPESLPNPNMLELAYALARKAWGRGLATEAAEAVVNYGFKEKGLEQVVAGIHCDNEASRRVLEKVGFREDPTLRFYGDCPHFRLAAAEFREAHP